jgi:hypothetical protein
VNYDGMAGNSLGAENLGNDYIDRAMIDFKASLARMDADPGAAARIRHLADVTDIQLAEKEVRENVRNLAARSAEAPARAETPTRAADGTHLPDELAEHSEAAADAGAPAVHVAGRAGPNMLRKVHSASVVALDAVSGLVVSAIDFATFIGTHPRALNLAQHLLDYKDTGKRRRSTLLTGQNCTILLTDVVGFGARSRTDSDRRLIRKTLFQLTQSALHGMPDAQSEDRGDGILTVVPPNVSTTEIVDRLLEKLPAALELHNRTHPDPARFKLRVAVSVGPVISDMGVSGEAIIVAARLVDAPRFKEAVAASTASLGVIVSSFVYETVIRHSADPRELASYSQVLVELKEFSATAWMKLLNAS